MDKEILRMQMLAGIITESQYKSQLNEDNAQEVIMYATYAIDNEAMRKSVYGGGDFPKDKVPTSFSGTSMSNGMAVGKDVILCSNKPWMIADDNDTPGIEIAVVKFKKPLTDVFLDDEQFLDYFGINEKYFDEIDEMWEEKDEVPLSDLVPYGLKDGKQRWYGCYVNDIKSDEIIEIKIAPPGEYDKGEWKKFTSPPTPIKRTSNVKPKSSSSSKKQKPERPTFKSFETSTTTNSGPGVMINLTGWPGNIFRTQQGVGEEKYEEIINNLENYDNNDSSKKYIDDFIYRELDNYKYFFKN
jgi:hypothetical protein